MNIPALNSIKIREITKKKNHPNGAPGRTLCQKCLQQLIARKALMGIDKK
jgi:ribosomal protein L34E